MIFILLLQLFTIQVEVSAELKATYRIIIDTCLLKNQLTLWSSEFPVEQLSSLCSAILDLPALTLNAERNFLVANGKVLSVYLRQKAFRL